MKYRTTPDHQQRGDEDPAAQLRAAGDTAFLAHAETFEVDRFLRLSTENVNLTDPNHHEGYGVRRNDRLSGTQIISRTGLGLGAGLVAGFT